MHITRTDVIQIQSHHKNGKSAEDIAKMTGIPVERVKGFLPKEEKVDKPLPEIDSTDESTDAAAENWEE